LKTQASEPEIGFVDLNIDFADLTMGTRRADSPRPVRPTAQSSAKPKVKSNKDSPMATYLRLIALTVDEPSPGVFQWALLESSSGPPLYDRPILATEEPYDSFEKAARAGLIMR
jgi:hypothetical protein